MRVGPVPVDERGAVVLLVAILMVVLLGMVVLVVDVGSLLVLQGRLGTAADSASLAAAQSCAMGREGEAQSEADAIALSNLAGVNSAETESFESSECGDSGFGSVSVAYSSQQDLYFAPVLGFDSATTVGGSASAMWGPATGAEPMPIVLSSGCDSRCSYWYEPDPGDVLPESPIFGFVHLAAWRILRGAPAPRCPRSAIALPSWIRGTQVVEVSLGQPPASACPIPGSGDWEDAISEQVGSSRPFVVNDADQMTGGQYAAVGFTPLVVESLTAPTFQDVDEVCATVTVDHLERDEVVPLTFDVLACLLQYGLDADLRLEVLPEDADWIFDQDPDTPLYLFTWLDQAVDNVRIDIIVTVEQADGGECGLPVPSEGSRCLTVSYEGPKVGGSEPNGSASDFGLRAIRLTGDQ